MVHGWPPSWLGGQHKASKVAKKSKTKIQLEDSDDEEALLVKNIKRGIGKYKGKLPLKCFNCGGDWSLCFQMPLTQTRR